MSRQELRSIFRNPPLPEDFVLTERERRILGNLLTWEKMSANMHWVLGESREGYLG